MAIKQFNDAVSQAESMVQIENPNPRRTIRDLDDGQSHILPDMTPQEFVEGMKNGNVNYRDLQKKGDSALFENLGDAVMGELNMSPEDYGKLINDNYAFHKAGTTYKWNDRYLDAWKKWNEGGRPKTDEGDWSWDYYTNYSPNGYLRWYRPQDQWGRADHIRVKNEWDEKYGPDVHDNFNPYKGYDTAYAAWAKFLKDYAGMVNPKLKNTLEWLKKNKEYF